MASTDAVPAANAASLPPAPRTIVVCGCTGRQGGAVVDALLARGAGEWRIVGVTRDPSQASAVALAARGVTLACADLQVRASIDAVLAAHAPVYAFFCVTNPFSSRWSGGTSFKTQKEESQGTNAVDAAAAAGVRHFIFTSVASAGESEVDGKPVETFQAKWRVEEHLRSRGAAAGLPWSIVAPTGFMENLISSYGLKQGIVPALLGPTTLTQMIAVADIGVFVRMMLEDPARWLGQRLEIAGDDTCAQVQAEAISAMRGGQAWKVTTDRKSVV